MKNVVTQLIDHLKKVNPNETALIYTSMTPKDNNVSMVLNGDRPAIVTLITGFFIKNPTLWHDVSRFFDAVGAPQPGETQEEAEKRIGAKVRALNEKIAKEMENE